MRGAQGARGRARGLGFAAYLHAAAETGKEGLLAHLGGVGILVRDDLVAKEVAWQATGELRHRMIGITVSAASGLELMATSLYMQDSLGPKGVNLDILAAFGDMVLAVGLPWLAQGDLHGARGAARAGLAVRPARCLFGPSRGHVHGARGGARV